MAEKSKRHITLVMPSSLYDRLNEMRWEQRERSFQGMVRKILEDRAEQYEAEREHRANGNTTLSGG